MLVITIALCTALVALVAWALWKLTYGGRPTDARERCRRDIATLRRTIGVHSAVRARDDVWSAGSDPGSGESRAKKKVAWLGTGAVNGGGCGGSAGCAAGCGGGGCGGCGGCGG